MKFKVLAGSHAKNGELIPKGTIFEDDAPLDKMFVGKFQRMEDSPAKPSKKKESVKTPTTTKPGPKYVAANSEFDFNPKDTGLRVKKVGAKYFVFDEDDLETPLNPKPLKKTQVEAYIDSQCEE